MRQTWIMSDPHFGHRVLETQNWRPKNFDERIYTNTLKCLKPNDTLLVLGDLFFNKEGEEMATRFVAKAKQHILPHGRLWLVLGNHDYHSSGWYLRQGWDWVSDGMYHVAYGKRLFFTHRPERLPSYCVVPVTPWYDFNIHGHTHGNAHRERQDSPYHIEIAPENMGYMPIPLSTLLTLQTTPLYRNGKFVRKPGHEPIEEAA